MLVLGVQHDSTFIYTLQRITIDLSPHKVTILFLVITFKIYFFSKFQFCNTVLLTTVTMLYITCSWFIYFITGILYLLIPFTHFTYPANLLLPLATPSLFSISKIGFVFFCFFHSTYKWNHIVFVFLWVISLSIIPSKFIHVVANGKISFFLWLSSIPLYICTTAPLSTHLLMGT